MKVDEFIKKLQEYPKDYDVSFVVRPKDKSEEQKIELSFLNDSNICKHLQLEFIKK